MSMHFPCFCPFLLESDKIGHRGGTFGKYPILFVVSSSTPPGRQYSTEVVIASAAGIRNIMSIQNNIRGFSKCSINAAFKYVKDNNSMWEKYTD
ncbi:hypothetical protein TNCT_277411 [Trichonephila clavata]|uniref:Uncharacterized protein n=1 Tax=Trichonephila clavata TaxID=2740835 RepID=A0A8X6J3C0_TRICU|nr:hypothetical protein TNCT_277411 [Trichonephila clavata]